MKHLTRIRLVNWHLFENTTITCQGSTHFIGVNGAGKSTILDALQFALVGGQRDVRFNQAAMSGSRRTLDSYVRGELGTEGQRYLRGDTTGLIALEFANSDSTCFVHGAMIDAYADRRTPNVAYFIVHNAELDDAWFFKAPGQLFDTRAFRRHLERFLLPKGGRAQVFLRLEDYRVHLLNRLGHLRDTFPAKIVKGVAFSPLTNIRDFVHNYLLDENLVDVKTLQEQLETLRHFEGLVADIQQRIAELERIESYDLERLANQRRRIMNGAIRRQAQADRTLAELKRRRLARDEADLKLQRAVMARDELQEHYKAAQEALLQAQIALKTDRTAIRQQELQIAITSHSDELTAMRERVSAIAAALACEASAMHVLRRLISAEGQPIPTEIDAFLEATAQSSANQETLHLDDPETTDHWQLTISALQSTLETLGQAYADRRALLVQRIEALRSDGQRRRHEIAQLRTGDHDASYEAEAPLAAQLRRLLRAELGLGSDEVIYLCQALQVADETWQDAVEGLLGTARFHLLVPPDHYDDAMALYRKRRWKDGLHGIGLPDSARILRAAATGKIQPRSAHSLAAEVHSDHQAARAYVDLLLGSYVKCSSIQELRQYRFAVTADCFVRHNYSNSHLDPRRYRRWFIGDRAIPRQIQEREMQLAASEEELTGLAKQMAELEQRLGLTRDRVRGQIELERELPVLAGLPGLEAHLEALKRELAELDACSVTTLEDQVSHAATTIKDLQDRLGEGERCIGGLQSQLTALDEEIIPQLEQDGVAASKQVQSFLLLEGADETKEEVEKEYSRRRQRQSLDTVLENATRYEGDYTTAEARSRDRLREAKQAYSLRYDFGYDDLEGGTRYIAERQKYVESELPAYEERVAHQRALAEQELVENFIHRLREQIEDARSQLHTMNATLSRLRFGGERYEFLATPAADLRHVYDMIMDSRAVLGASLFGGDFQRKHQEGLDLLFEWLTVGPHDELLPELRRLQDYRNYLTYDIRIHYPNGDRALHSQISAKKSGGETTTPFYVAMAASFAQAYRLNQPRPADTIRLAIFDEAFGKMDSARTASALKFMVNAGLQVILATPPDKASGLLQHVDSVRTVVRQNSHSFVLEIDKHELQQETEQGA